MLLRATVYEHVIDLFFISGSDDNGSLSCVSYTNVRCALCILLNNRTPRSSDGIVGRMVSDSRALLIDLEFPFLKV